ncbi:MAG TPA: hypothetical protein PKH79_05020 [Prolixibacteraceae bacterium]|nr:hypothetical protein [Prolixibacteraceae bacterium]
MSDRARIPRTIDAFNPYINLCVTYLSEGTPQTNEVRLGISVPEMTQLNQFLTKWNSVYPSYSDKKNSRTTAVTEELNLLIRDFCDYDHQQHLLDRIAASPNATVADLETFNIKKGLLEKGTHTRPNTPIEELVVPSIQLIGGGMLAFKCRCASGEGASIIEGANCVQFRFKTGTVPPVSVEDETLKSDLSTKANFTLNAGGENSGKYLYIYFRWYNTRYPALAGPWSVLYVSLIP